MKGYFLSVEEVRTKSIEGSDGWMTFEPVLSKNRNRSNRRGIWRAAFNVFLVAS